MLSIQETDNTNRYASFYSRIAAFFIDVVLVLVLAAFFYMGFKSINFYLLYLVLWLLYDFFMTTSDLQATIGKNLVGLRIYSEDGTSPTSKQTLLRISTSLLSYLFFLPGLMLFFTQKKQTMHDKLSRTVIIDYTDSWGIHSYFKYIAGTFFVISLPIYFALTETLFDTVSTINFADFFLVKKNNELHFITSYKSDSPLAVHYEQGQAPLMLAITNNDSMLISNLLRTGLDFDMKDNANKTAWDYIDHVKQKGLYSEMKIQQAFNATPPFNGEEVSSEGSYNSKTGEVSVKRYGINKKTWSPLCLAIEQGDKPKVKQYIEQRLYLETPTNNGSTPIFFAIFYQQDEILNWLLEEKVNIEHKNTSGITPLYLAVKRENELAVELLLKHGADMYAMDMHESYNPFFLAADKNISLLKLFLKYGVDVNYQYKKSETALTISVKECKHLDNFKLLLEHGANPNLIDKFGVTTKTALKRYCRNDSNYATFYQLMK